jgi:hypothetical protein
MKEITKRSPEQIANELHSLDDKDMIRTILHCDKNRSSYTFTFDLIASLIYNVKQEGDYTSKKAIQNMIDSAEIISMWEDIPVYTDAVRTLGLYD